MRRFRFRPLGLVGSMLEILVGHYLLRSVIWADEDYAPAFVTLIGAAGLLVLLLGIVGVVCAARNRLRG